MMKIFKKLFKEKDDVNYDTDTIKTSAKTSKAKYLIEVKEKFGKGTTTLKTITAERFVDQDDHVIYLRNSDQKFLELFPQDENDFLKLDKKTIDTTLTALRKKYREEVKKEDPTVNPKNLLFDIMKYEAKARALKYDSESAYMTITASGAKKFYFLREGSTFFPFKWDTDNSCIYVASENKKKKAGIARRNKNIKYSKFKNTVEGSVMFLLILVIIATLANGFIAYKFFQKFDDSKIIEAQNFCVQKGAEWTAIVERNAKASETIMKSLSDKAQGKNTIVNSFLPKELENSK